MTTQTENYEGFKQVEVLFFHEESYRGIDIKYGQSVDENGIKYYSCSNNSPFFLLTGPDVKTVKNKAISAVESYRDFEEKDWGR